MMFRSSVSAILFLSTPSARRATRPADGLSEPFHISIHALREEGDHAPSRANLGRNPISIHALREEGDRYHTNMITGEMNFYPRPPRGGRPIAVLCRMSTILFLSTPSARRATWAASAARPRRANFYPRPPRGGRPPALRDGSYLAGLFLSTPSARRATPTKFTATITPEFLSTPSARRATQSLPALSRCPKYFYPRPPRGGRPMPS